MSTDPSKWSDRVDQGLFTAIAEGNLAHVKMYCDQGANLYRTMDPEGRQNPLRLAVIRSELEIVRYLVEEKHVKPAKDVRVMCMAIMAEKKPKEAFRYLAQQGGDVNAVDPVLGTPLIMALRDMSPRLKAGEEERDPLTTEKGRDMVRFLVEEMKVSVDFVTPNKGTALHTACEHCAPDMVDYLLEHGASRLLNFVNDASYTPLTTAAAKGRVKTIELLVKKWKCDVNAGDEVNPLFMAVQYRRIPAVKLLIELGADVRIAQKETQATALHLAASNNFLDIVELLIKADAVVDCEDPRGYTPLLMAGTEGYTTCVKMLIEAGADVSHRAHSDMATPLFHCAGKNRVDVVRILLEHGANPLDTRDEQNRTIEEIARAEGRLPMANLLASWVATVADPSERVKICSVCNKYEKGKQKRCTRCKARWYCSVDCQKSDWETHRFNCKPAAS